MKPIFNSLGSNYSFTYALTALKALVDPDKQSNNNLKAFLGKEFKGDTFLFYKGRDALEFLLRALKIGKGSDVIIQAFTCYALEEAILRAGANPVFTDIEKGSLNLSLATLEAAYAQAKNPQVLVVQYTLGIPVNILKIKQWCQKKGMLLIEDLAQAYGGKDTQGAPLGSYGDAVILSFGRDKILDAVSGGAGIIKCKYQKIAISGSVSWSRLFKDLIYPVLTWKIRFCYSFGLGKLLHKVAVFLSLIESPVKSYQSRPLPLPDQYAALVLNTLKHLDEQLAHRRDIAKIYWQSFPADIVPDHNILLLGNCLRFPLIIAKPNELISNLEKQSIYISDRWYRKAVDCGKCNCISNYIPGSCPHAEETAQHIINLPTHRFISRNDAQRIVYAIKLFCSF